MGEALIDDAAFGDHINDSGALPVAHVAQVMDIGKAHLRECPRRH